jgi:hypothetical protein
VCGRRPARVGGGTAGRMRARGFEFPPNHTGIPRSALGAPFRGAGSEPPRRALGCEQDPDGRAAASSRHTRGRRARVAHADRSQSRGAGCAPLVCPQCAPAPARPRRGPAPAQRAGLGIRGCQAGRAGPRAADPPPWPWPGPGRRQLESRGGLEAGSFGGCVNGLRHGSRMP